MCDVCRRDTYQTLVCSSSLGPVSLAYCEECLKKPAEPLWGFEYIYEVNGPDVADWVTKLFSYKDGAYISWAEFLEDK